MPSLPAASAASTINGEIVTYEVPSDARVTREVPSDEVVVKEIPPPHIVIRRNNPPRKQASMVVPQAPRAPRSFKAPPSIAEPKLAASAAEPQEVSDLASFLDRLMHAESRGRDHAANPRSTALGPFQFIKSTFLDVARRHFPAITAELSDTQVLALRTTRPFARSAAKAYTLENAARLKTQGHEPTWPHLRLAFLLGPDGASRVLAAPSNTPLTGVLPGGVLQANPFMKRMTTADLIAKAERDVVGRQPATATSPADAAADPMLTGSSTLQ
jgi:hypothetical protein